MHGFQSLHQYKEEQKDHMPYKNLNNIKSVDNLGQIETGTHLDLTTGSITLAVCTEYVTQLKISIFINHL